ncbi:arylamine N-acetyltransferase family protein [Streptomyces sp. bgisy154]|uniref:arylamine N-acetyltransferase family protein n=1 Tax=Streptomyces sp. bgisy154 TaxID=3413794 RepID=UPI003D7298F2
MDSVQVDAYLRRLGAERPARPTVEALRELHVRHLRAVPFENLSIHLGEEIVLEEKRLVDKVVGAHRGGFCYELNGAFGALLGALGFEVALLAARVHGEGERRWGVPYDHMALRVVAEDGSEWLADVGFGEHSHYPLAFGERGEQVEPGGVFRLVEAEEADDLDVVRNGRVEYRLELRPRVLGDFVTGAWWHRTSPESGFTRSLVCSRNTEDGGRVTLSGRRLKETTADGTVARRELAGDEEVLAVYRERFGIELGRVPEVRKSIER